MCSELKACLARAAAPDERAAKRAAKEKKAEEEQAARLKEEQEKEAEELAARGAEDEEAREGEEEAQAAGPAKKPLLQAWKRLQAARRKQEQEEVTPQEVRGRLGMMQSIVQGMKERATDLESAADKCGANARAQADFFEARSLNVPWQRRGPPGPDQEWAKRGGRHKEYFAAKYGRDGQDKGKGKGKDKGK